MDVRQSVIFRLPRSVLILATAMIWPYTASSHHSFSSLLTPDGEETIYVRDGTVRVFRILNPHGALILDATDDAGAAEGWLIELSPPMSSMRTVTVEVPLMVRFGLKIRPAGSLPRLSKFGAENSAMFRYGSRSPEA